MRTRHDFENEHGETFHAACLMTSVELQTDDFLQTMDNRTGKSQVKLCWTSFQYTFVSRDADDQSFRFAFLPPPSGASLGVIDTFGVHGVVCYLLGFQFSTLSFLSSSGRIQQACMPH